MPFDANRTQVVKDGIKQVDHKVLAFLFGKQVLKEDIVKAVWGLNAT